MKRTSKSDRKPKEGLVGWRNDWREGLLSSASLPQKAGDYMEEAPWVSVCLAKIPQLSRG